MLKDKTPVEIIEDFMKSINKDFENEWVSEVIDYLVQQGSKFFKEKYPGEISKEYNVELKEKYGGEDQGSTYYHVFKITKADNEEDFVYIKISGYYSSYNGTEYESWKYCAKFVQPVEVTIIKYQEIK